MSEVEEKTRIVRKIDASGCNAIEKTIRRETGSVEIRDGYRHE
jgi:DNA-binding transcriptional regulator YdaS (Cro superfamily)